ncbi:MAG: hypothetical protein JSU08_03560 [Acidobacteria bacterium]|nr:hypothetical protein [Acidobacteriota bacterium]
MSGEREKVVHVSTREESGGITATVTTDAGNVYTGRSYPDYPIAGLGLIKNEASEDKAVRDATRKIK